jgi:hypothetical protein
MRIAIDLRTNIAGDEVSLQELRNCIEQLAEELPFLVSNPGKTELCDSKHMPIGMVTVTEK